MHVCDHNVYDVRHSPVTESIVDVDGGDANPSESIIGIMMFCYKYCGCTQST